jgi:hypothetical protein
MADVEATHPPVAQDLRDDAGRGNRQALRVARDERLLGAVPARERLVAVNDEVRAVRGLAQVRKRTAHGEEGGLQDVALGDLRARG